MLEPFDQIHRTLTSRNERKELLVLACEVDRLSWRQACRPARHPAAQLARQLLGCLGVVGTFLPGRPGRWLQSAGMIAQLGRRFGWVRW